MTKRVVFSFSLILCLLLTKSVLAKGVIDEVKRDLILTGNDIVDVFNVSMIGTRQLPANFQSDTELDIYSVFFNTASVTVAEPELQIIETILDLDGITDITGTTIGLGTEFFYELEIENIGDEDFVAGSVLITDILPVNTDLVSITNVPPGVTYTIPSPGILVFDIPADIVETPNDGTPAPGVGDGPIFIRFRVSLVNTCEELRDACSDDIRNSVSAAYTGLVSGIAGSATSQSPNVFVYVPACESDVTFCNDDLLLVAGTGFNQYTWSGPSILPPVVTTVNFYQVPAPLEGIYTVIKEDTDGVEPSCSSLTEEFTATNFNNGIQNPILDYVDGTTVITENCFGLSLPQILLCSNDTLLLETNFDPSSLNSISWQLLNPSGACVADPNDPCSLLDGNCINANWIEVVGGDTVSYTVDTAGDYRILADFDGGCSIPFYFSVFKNDYLPILSVQPIECGNDGSVTVTNVPNNFAFSLTSGGPYTNITGIFPISNPGDITVYATDTAFPGCEYTDTINIQTYDPVFSVTTIDPSCINDENNSGTGTIVILVTGGIPEYEYTISSPVLGASNPIIVPNGSANNGNYMQTDLPSGTYTVEVVSNRPTPSCYFVTDVTINPAPVFDAEVVLIASETCDSGALVQVNVLNGSGNYAYADSEGIFGACNIFEIPSPADPLTSYTFSVSDKDIPLGTNACIITASIDNITSYEPIVIDTVVITQPACTGDFGQIFVEVSPVVAGRVYTYQLWDCALDPNCGITGSSNPSDDEDPSLWTLVNEIGSTTNQTITFTDVSEGDSYVTEVLIANTTPTIDNLDCSFSTPAETICPVRQSNFTINSPGFITTGVSLNRLLSCIAGSEDALIEVDNIQGGSGTYEWSLDNTTYTNVTTVPFDITVNTSGSYTVYIRNQGTSDCAITTGITVPDLPIVDSIVFTAGTSDCATQSSIVSFEVQPALSAGDIATGVAYEYNVSPDPATLATATGSTGFVLTNSYTIAQDIDYTVVARRSDDKCSTTDTYRVDGITPIQNPILNYVNGTTVITETCSVNGLSIPKILLCGNDTLLLETNFDPSSLNSISWQLLNPSGACVADSNDPCSSLDGNCTNANWIEVVGGDTVSYTVDMAGDYRIVADFNGSCFENFYFSVFKNDYLPILSAQPIECGNDGSVTVTNVPDNFAFSLTSGGPYTNTTGIFPISNSGNITVYAIDTTFPGCEYIDTINVQTYDPVFSVTTIDPSCINDEYNSGTGTIIISVTGGIPEYEYTITSPVLANPIIIPNASANNGNYSQTDLLPGTYTVEIISNRPTPECTFNTSVTINPAPVFDAEVVLIASETCDSGTLVQVNVLNGSGNYEYADSEGVFGACNIFEIPSPADPSATYTFSVSDKDVPLGTNACIITASIDNITSYEPIVIDTVVITQPACTGDFGQIFVEVSPVVAGRVYTYQLWDCALDPNCGTPGNEDPFLWTLIDDVVSVSSENITFSNVIEGNSYVVTAVHENTTPTIVNTNCSFSAPSATICPVSMTLAQIISPIPITADVALDRVLSCIAGSEDALIEVDNIQGGSGTYEWSLDNTTYTNVTTVPFDIIVNTSGSYTVYIRNQVTSDCTITTAITVPALPTVESIIFTAGTSDCTTQTSIVSFELQPALSASDIAAGVVHEYSVSPDPTTLATATGSTGFVLTNSYTIAQDIDYTVVARRSDDQCATSDTYIVAPILPIDISTATETTPVVCFGDSNGALSFSVINSTSFDYIITLGGIIIDSASGVTISLVNVSGLAAGTYTIVVTDTNPGSSGSVLNCSDTIDVTITEPVLIDIQLEVSPVTVSQDGVITVSPSGGIVPYLYELLDTTSAAVIIASQNSNILVIDTPGDYIVRVTDGNGCTSEEPVTVLLIADNPITDYAGEILYCTVTGQSYPLVTIQDQNGEVLEVPFTDVLSIVWQQLDTVSCNVPLDDTCPTTDLSCTSDWFDIANGSGTTITLPGEYRVVITFNVKSNMNIKTYYFRVDSSTLNIPDVAKEIIKMYPNPSRDIVNVNTEVKDIIVFDVSGKKVLEVTQKQFSITNLEKGIYFARVNTIYGNSEMIKFIKK